MTQQGNRAGHKHTLRDMSDEQLALSYAHLCELMSEWVTELSRRGLYKNYKQTHAELKEARQERERAEKAAEGGPQPMEHDGEPTVS